MKHLGAKESRKEGEGEVEVMDQEVWKEFPEELLEVVIARLPILTLNRHRLVCQKWNSLLKSPCFQQLWESFAQHKKPLLFSVDVEDSYGYGNVGAVYDPSRKKWRYGNNAPLSSYRGLLTAASAGGLVCYYHRFSGSFWVGNCLTQTWKTVPSLPWTPIVEVAVGMVNLNQDYSQPSARGYKIIAVDSRGNYLVYDSIKDSSTSTRRIPANINLHSQGFCMRSVSIDTVVYFLARNSNGLISYDTASGAWEQFSIQAPPNSYNVCLAECGGQILLVGQVGNEDSPSSVCVWELETATLHWKEVDRMPSAWSWDGRVDRWLFCLGNRRVLMMLLYSFWGSLIIMYDVVSREWSKAPLFTKPWNRFPPIENAVGFFPCLSASP